MNKKNLTRVAGLSAAAMLALSGMAMAETTESALVKGGALNLRETASLDAKVLGHIGARGTSYWNVRLLDAIFDFDEIRVHSRRPLQRLAHITPRSRDVRSGTPWQ